MTYPPGPPTDPPGPPDPGVPPPPPPPQSQPDQPYGVGPGPGRTNVLAVVSLVLSILSFCALPVIGAIGGIVTGYMAKRQIRETGEDGAGMATAGIVIGWIHIALAVLTGVVAIVALIAALAISPRHVDERPVPSPYESSQPGPFSPSPFFTPTLTPTVLPT